MCRPRQLPNEETCALPELEQAMACCPDGKSYRRLYAIHLLLIGVGYDHVLRNCGRGERCLGLWISRFNEQGIDGLTYRPRGGRPRKLSAATVESEILPVVDDPSLAGQLHWTAVKLSGWLRQEYTDDPSSDLPKNEEPSSPIELPSAPDDPFGESPVQGADPFAEPEIPSR